MVCFWWRVGVLITWIVLAILMATLWGLNAYYWKKRQSCHNANRCIVNIATPEQQQKQGGVTMKDRIDALEAIGAKARKITTEIAGNYVIAVSTEAAKKKKYLCVYQSAKGLKFEKGAVHNRTLVKAFPYSNEEGYVEAYKSALKFIAVLEHKIEV